MALYGSLQFFNHWLANIIISVLEKWEEIVLPAAMIAYLPTTLLAGRLQETIESIDSGFLDDWYLYLTSGVGNYPRAQTHDRYSTLVEQSFNCKH